MSGATNPTVSEVRAPNTSRESMSRPNPSVPSQCCASGGMRRKSISISFGLGSGSSSASAAAATISAIHAAASQNTLPSRRRQGIGAIAGSTAASNTAMADPRIEHGVEQVHDEVQQHEADRDQQHDALQDDEVARVDRADQQPADAGQGEDRLD